MIHGSCACGAIRFEIDKVRSLTHCHCSNCRKLTGAAFATYAHVSADKFRLTSGEDMMFKYESSPGSFRNRCKTCGCVTHMEAQEEPPWIYGLNMRLLTGGLDRKSVVLRQIDNGHTGSFFTATDEPELVSRHPVEPPHEWR